jgi:hypothetical protein
LVISILFLSFLIITDSLTLLSIETPKLAFKRLFAADGAPQSLWSICAINGLLLAPCFGADRSL